MTKLPAPKSKYLATPDEWESLRADLLLAAASGWTVGFDTETLGCNPREDSAVGMSRICLWSLGFPNLKAPVLSPRGFYRSEGYVLPPAALPVFAHWFASQAPKVAHNRRYDQHALANEGFELVNCIDTVDVLRVCHPGLDAYGMKPALQHFADYETYGTFKQVFSEAIFVTRKKWKKTCPFHGDTDDRRRKFCESCPQFPRSERTELIRVDWEEREELKMRRQVSLQEVLQVPVGEMPVGSLLPIVPYEHPLFETAVDYAGLDAIGAADLVQLKTILHSSHRPARVPCF
jgi:hypothetical protein